MTGEVDQILSQYEQTQSARLQALRAMIHETGRGIEEISEVEETLKWGQPSFVTRPKKIGSTVRIDGKNDGVSIYFTCSTNLVARFRELYPETFDYVGNREIHFSPDKELPQEELKHCIAMALTYHLNKKK